MRLTAYFHSWRGYMLVCILLSSCFVLLSLIKRSIPLSVGSAVTFAFYGYSIPVRPEMNLKKFVFVL